MSLIPLPHKWNKLVHLVHSPNMDLWIIDPEEIADRYENHYPPTITGRHDDSNLSCCTCFLCYWLAAKRQAQWFRDSEDGILLICKRELIQHSWFLINSSLIYNRHRVTTLTAITCTHTRLYIYYVSLAAIVLCPKRKMESIQTSLKIFAIKSLVLFSF